MASISRASEVIVMAMAQHAAAALPHGGDLGAARRQFPSVAQPFIDLSTGINPHAYPVTQLSPDLFARLPQSDALARLVVIAAKFYGAPSPDCVVAAPGTQILFSPVAALAAPGQARILGPTYAEHAAVAARAGHATTEVAEVHQLAEAGLAVVVNPNNPDGRLVDKARLLSVAHALRSRAGLLVVDESFMDVAGADATLAGEVLCGNLVVLRSFGKFFGLAGLRLGFALAAPDIAARLAAWLGPWAVAGPASAVGETALADAAWGLAMRKKLREDAQRLDATLLAAGLHVIGGTSLFRLAQTPAAAELYQHLGHAGILVRRFTEQPDWLRFGLPGEEEAWARLRSALACFRATGSQRR
jgi:cobalamin biosynthetic protein CobC